MYFDGSNFYVLRAASSIAVGLSPTVAAPVRSESFRLAFMLRPPGWADPKF